MALLEYRPTKPIHHYCSAQGFRGVLESRTLWFSDLTMTNDPRELLLGRTELLEAFRHVRHNTGMGEAGIALSVLYSRCESNFDKMQYFSCCFTEKPDSLPMWREYADGGNGFVISFRPAAILSIPARLQKVNYMEGEPQEALRSIIDRVAKPIRTGIEIFGEDNQQLIIDTVVKLVANVTALKHQTWRDEGEIRMVHTMVRDQEGRAFEEKLMRDAFRNNSALRTRLGVQTRQRNAEDIDYIPFPFGKYSGGNMDHSRAIKSVTLGPKCALSVSETEKLLEKNGFRDYRLCLSECAVR